MGAKPPPHPTEAKFIFDSAPHYLQCVNPVFRLCQYVLQFIADNVEDF